MSVLPAFRPACATRVRARVAIPICDTTTDGSSMPTCCAAWYLSGLEQSSATQSKQPYGFVPEEIGISGDSHTLCGPWTCVDQRRGVCRLCDRARRRIVQTLVKEEQCLSFSLSGLSKVCGLPQMKLGWIVATGPGHQQALERLEWIADTFLSVGTPVQLAAPVLLEAGQSVQAQIRERTTKNLAFLRAAVTASCVVSGRGRVVRYTASTSSTV